MLAQDYEVKSVIGEAGEFIVRQLYKRGPFMFKNKLTAQEKSVMFDVCKLPKDNWLQRV